MYSISKPYPNKIIVGGKTYAVNLSFDRVLAAINLLCKEEFADKDINDIVYSWLVTNRRYASTVEKAETVSYIFNNMINDSSHVADDQPETISFEQDAKYIYAAFRQAYGINLFDAQGKLQWWEFSALLQSLPDDTRMSQIIDIRAKPIPAPTKYNRNEIEQLTKLKNIYAIRKPVSAKQAQDAWDKLFNILEQKAGE